MAGKVGIKKFVRFINKGGMGKVDEVELTDGTRAAMKTFDPNAALFSDVLELAKLRKRFDKEVRYQTQLGLNGAMPVLFQDMSVDPPFFVMPLAEKSYADQIKEDRAADRISLEPLLDILSGLEQLHELGFVHRDLKPENALLWRGQWRLSDFGLTVNQGSTETSRYTGTDSAWGTRAYMAPEQMTDFRNVTPAADIYAFGCILHDLIAGTPRVPYAVQSVPGSPYDYIVRKCTANDPTKRFRSIATLRASLVDELRRDPSLQRTPSTDQWGPELPNIAAWDEQKLDEFLAHLENARPGNEMHVIADIREDHIAAFGTKAPGDWEAFALAYCEWARAAFTFEFCDVIAGCLRSIYVDPMSRVTVRSAVAASMAILGAQNNRWYCMRLLHPMTNTEVPAPQAQRIALEIRANDWHNFFEHCAREVYGWDRAEYHPRILEVLEEKLAPTP